MPESVERGVVFTDLGLKDFHCCSHASGAWKTQAVSSGVLWAVRFCFVLELFVLFLFRAISVCRGFCVVIFLFRQTVGGIIYLPLSAKDTDLWAGSVPALSWNTFEPATPRACSWAPEIAHVLIHV